MKSTVTSLTRITKLDIKNHGLTPGRHLQGVWQDCLVEFEYQGGSYTAFTVNTVGSQRRPCQILIRLAGILVEVIEPPPPRKHYYDEDGDPQYQIPQDLAEKWVSATLLIHEDTVINILYAVRQAYLLGTPSPTKYPVHLVRVTEELYRDFVQQGFFPQEFPLIFHNLPSGVPR